MDNRRDRMPRWRRGGLPCAPYLDPSWPAVLGRGEGVDPCSTCKARRRDPNLPRISLFSLVPFLGITSFSFFSTSLSCSLSSFCWCASFLSIFLLAVILAFCVLCLSYYYYYYPSTDITLITHSLSFPVISSFSLFFYLFFLFYFPPSPLLLPCYLLSFVISIIFLTFTFL